MKTFKKAISLVLVFAMLASFAGMTGYSPMSIEAEAAVSVGTKTKHYLSGGATITVADSLYKSNSSDYNLKYRDYTSEGATGAITDVKEGYYTVGTEIPGNDLSFSISCPEGTTYWKFIFSLDTTTEMAGFDSDATNLSGYDRSASDTMTDEYGVVLGRRLDTPEKQGFRDVDKVYYILDYTVNGQDYYDYVEVKLYDYAKKDDVNVQTWTKPASQSKPTDSFAGSYYAMKSLKVPSTVYVDSTNKIITTTPDGDQLDQNISFAIPAEATHLTIKWSVNWGKNWYTTWDYGTDVIHDPQFLIDTNGNGTLGDHGDYIEYTGPFGLDGGGVDASALVVESDCDIIEYEISYVVPVTLANGTKREITFTQYAASYVKKLGLYNAGYQGDFSTSRGDSDHNLAVTHWLRFADLLKQGLAVEATAQDNDKSLSYGSIINSFQQTHGNGMAVASNGVFHYQQADLDGRVGSSSTGAEVTGDSRDAADGNNSGFDNPESAFSTGANIYFDPQANSTATFRLDYNFYDTDYGSKKSTSIDEFAVGWYNVSSKQPYEKGTGDWVSTGGSQYTYNEDSADNNQNPSGLAISYLSGTMPSPSAVSSYNGNNNVPLSTTFSINCNHSGFTVDSNNANKKLPIYIFMVSHLSTAVQSAGSYKSALDYTVGMHINLYQVNRSVAHEFVEAARTNNYVQEEMSSGWWKRYKEAVFDEYRRLGNLTDTTSGPNANGDGYETHITEILEKPEYVFADYSEIQAQLTTTAEWDRGGATTDGTNAVTDGLSWGTGYAKYNATTYNSGITDRSPRAGAVSGSLAAYDLKFDRTTKALYISDEIRTGEYYYTAASWQAYEDARFAAMNAYNYPTKAPKTAADYAAKQEGHDYDEVKFDYDATYPEKEASTTASNGAGLACYCKAEIDTATVALEAARAGLKKKGENGNTEYDHVDDAYQYLISATSAAVYDGVDDLRAYVYNYTDPVTGETETRPIKHGLAGIYDSTINPDNNNGNQHNYQVASLMFRANHEKDVFNYIFTEEQAALWNERNPDKRVSSGAVRTDEDGNPLVLIDKGTDLVDYIDDTVELASNVEGNTYYDAGILSFPKVDGTRGPVGRGNTFTQLAFDNSAYSNNAVDKMRTAIGNRINWGKGGYNEYYPYLGMVEGAYQGDANGKDEKGNTVKKMTEQDLIDNPGNWTWKEIEHRDDILRAAYALTLVAPTIRLATSYREVEEILNNQDNDKNRGDEILVPPYDIGGSVYNDKQLWKVTIFHDYDGSYDTEDDAFEYNNRTYNTTGKTWYTEESWNTFAAARDELAKLIFNGSVTGGVSDNIVNQYNVNEIEQNFVYQSMLGQTHYTYDQYYDLTGQKIITRVAPKDSDTEGIKNFVGYYTNGHYANQQDIEAGGISNLAADANGQAKVNEKVDAYYAAMEALELKDLDAYTWKPYNETTVSSIEQKVASLYKEIDTTQAFVDFLPTTEDGTLTGATLSDTEIKLYAQADINELNALADYVTALHESTTAEAVYKGTDSLADNADAFDKALTAFNEKYIAIKNGGYQVDKSSWGDIFTHLTTLAGGTSITQSNILAKFTTLYNDTNADVNGHGDVYNAIDAAIDAYVAATTQAEVNAAVTALYNALATPLTSKEVGTAADEAIAYPKNLTFNVYNYTMSAQAGKNETPSRFTADSVAELTTAATQAKNSTYNMLGTYTSSLTAKAAEVTALKNLKSDDNGGVLVYTGAVTTYLEQAIAYAESELYSDVENQVVKTTHVTNPAETASVDVPLYSEQSVAELKVTLTEAKAALEKAKSGEYGWAEQIELDKYTYLVYDETAPDTGDNKAAYLLVTNIISNYNAPYTWSTVADGVVTKTDNWEGSANANYAEGLYGDKDRGMTMTGMANAGLQSGPAYYGFLDAEYKATTVVKTNDDGTTTTTDYKDTVWDGDGNLITTDGVEVGVTTFTNWSSYKEYYDKYATLDKNLTISSQQIVTDLAENIYRTRNALELMNRYFPNNTEDFETAKGWYNALAAYVQKTDVARYGWEYVDVTEEVTDETTGEVTTVTTTVFQKSENPLSSVEQSVYIYNGITPEIEAEIEKFRAKYASDSSTEDYYSLGAAETLYNNIKEALTDPETNALYTVKKTNDESLIAGMLDLTGRIDPETQELVGGYLAGTWTVTFDEETGASTGVYATDLLNSTQAGLLQTYLTNVQNKINSKEDATAGFGGALGALTTIVFDETKKPATDLQFANAMKQQMVEFFGMTFIANVPDYYKVPASFLNDDGEFELYVFDQTNANKLLTENVNPFYNNEENWPCIYEINNLQVVQDTSGKSTSNKNYGVYDVTVWPSGTTDSEGNPVSSGTGADKKIDTIMKEIGANSKYYADVIAQTNSYHTDALAWIVENAIVDGVTTTDGEVASVILADLNNSVDGDNGSKTQAKDTLLTSINNTGKSPEDWTDIYAEIDYRAKWYTEGYGCYTDAKGRVYYLYKGNKEIHGSNFGSWFNDTTGTLGNPKVKYDDGIDVLQSILDKDYVGNSNYKEGKNYYGSTLSERFTHTDYSQIANIAKNERPSGTGTEDYAASIASAEVGWSQYYAEKLQTSIQTDQDAIDESAALIYEKIQGLTLLPATEAYRDVYNTYLSIFGQHIADENWNGDSFNHAKLDENDTEMIDSVDFKFYNINDTQLSRIQADFTLNEEAVPAYGLVLRSKYSNFAADSYITSGEYTNNETDNPWYNLVITKQEVDEYHNPDSFMNKFIGTKPEDMITIDQAEKVNTYDNTDNITSIMETLVDDYLSKLEFKDRDFSYLDAVVKAFLGDNLANGLAAVKSTLQNDMGFTVGGNYEGQFYPLSYYTDDSLLQVAGILRSQNVLADGKIIEKIINTEKYKWIGDTFPLPIVFNIDYKGSFYTSSPTQEKIDSSKEADNSVLLAFLTALNEDLELKPVDTDGYKNSEGHDITGIETAIKEAEAIIASIAKYDTTDASWKTFEEEYAKAETLFGNAKNYNITDQQLFDDQTSALLTAISNLKLLADDYAPSMTLKTSVAGVEEFYSKEAYEVALRQADSASFTATGEGDNTTYTANPAAGTFFVPNSSGYSLIVYTNELNPRIVINLEDLEQKLADGTNGSADVMQDAAKQEYISINAKRTSGVVTNVIAGTIVPAHDNIAERMEILGQTDSATGAIEATATNAVTVTNNNKNVKGSSAFAVLAPQFVTGKATQAAVYTIEARDGSERNVDGGTVYGNPVNQLDFGDSQDPVDIKVLDSDNKIAIYIYYYSLKAADGRDEGINADGTALAAPAIEGTNVPNILLSGEPGFKGTDWRNGVLLQRSFSSSHRVWEYVSEVKKSENSPYNNVNGTLGVPVYNDPTFGYLNTGSFYYVLDDEADADIIEAYNNAKSSSTTAGCMDYAAATDAKTAMISAINAADATKLSEMKASGRFYNYGDYETDEFGNVLYNGDEPKWINWAQAIGGKVENGDLVFVHVVDRWGNVVNRIIEITNLDENAPEVSSDVAGAVTIDETGGSGLADIQVHNGDFSIGEFQYQVSQNQSVELGYGKVVNCASNVLTIVNLVPGKTYLIGAEDKAGNRSTTAVKADAEGHIVLTIGNKIVQTGEDMSLEGNSSAFTLNGTDTIILNSGEESSVINAKLEGNVFANRTIRHYITTKDNVEALKTVYQDGTVEEFTAENATVKDNGDGTLVWTIKRKLAEGEHKYDVYAKVNGKYETYYAVAVINATTRTVKIECTNVGQGATELKFSGSLSFDIANYISKEVPYGAQVTITAKAYTAYEGCEFYYWINNTTDRIINTADVYEFKAVANADYIAQFTNNSTCIDGKKFVVYVNNAKNVIDRFELAEGDDYAVPSGPVLPDYTFKGWSMTKAEVLASDKATVIVEPIYELNASYTVSIAQGNYTATGAGTYTAEANQRAVVTISTSAKDGEGKDFLYWIDADTDEIVSYDRTYSFFCVKDTELAPVYGDASTVKAEPIVRITEVKFNAFSGKASFFAERSVPEEYTILQTGIVVTKTETIGTNEEVFVVGGTSTAAGTSTSTANNGYYSASTSVATGQTVWARAYVIYETADGEILEVYGPVVSYTVD